MKKYFQITWRLWKLLKPFHKYFYTRLFFIISLQFIAIYSTLLISKVLDKSVAKDWHLVIIYLVVYLILLGLNKTFSFISEIQEIKNSYGHIQQFLEEY